MGLFYSLIDLKEENIDVLFQKGLSDKSWLAWNWIYKAGLKLRDPSAPAAPTPSSPSGGMKGMHHPSWQDWLFSDVNSALGLT